MRFMILLKADKNTETGVPPSTELIAAMMKYNEELTKSPASHALCLAKRLSPFPAKGGGDLSTVLSDDPRGIFGLGS